jgi:hypothetical protein
MRLAIRSAAWNIDGMLDRQTRTRHIATALVALASLLARSSSPISPDQAPSKSAKPPAS